MNLLGFFGDETQHPGDKTMPDDNGQQLIARSLAGTLSAEEVRVIQAVLEALRRIRYGSVQVVVQDGKVLHIETVEKTRLTK